MKRVYKIFLTMLCAVVALSFLPWLYGIVFPVESNEPFVTYSPVSNCFVVSTTGADGTVALVGADGTLLGDGITKAERDSLVPQMYFTQLIARNALPDTIAGKAVDVPTLKQAQWVFNSLPRDINRHNPGIYPIMESRPKRVELEDPKEVFTLDDGTIRFIDMATNKENAERSRRFAKVLADKGFIYPAISASADITARKAYDEGYLLVDSDHKLFHMKMQAGQPYVMAIAMPDGAVAEHAFILENPDKQHIGLVTTADGSLYAIEREGYVPVKLPIEGINPEKQRIMIMKNLFNWMIRVTDYSGTRWIALDSDDYSLLGEYIPQAVSQGGQASSLRHQDAKRQESIDGQLPHSSTAQKVARWIFPFTITFTDINDCYAFPRVGDFSWRATILWLLILTVISISTFKFSKR